jgi:hypothetical protein
VNGSQIEFAWDDGQRRSASLQRNTDSSIAIGGVDLDRVAPADGVRLDGTYTATSSSQLAGPGAGTLIIEHTIRFAADGRFAQARDSGSYDVVGNTMVLTARGGRRQLTFFVLPEGARERRPRGILIDGVVFRLED